MISDLKIDDIKLVYADSYTISIILRLTMEALS